MNTMVPNRQALAAQVELDAADTVTDAEIEAAAAVLWQSFFDHPDFVDHSFAWNEIRTEQKSIYLRCAREMIEAAKKARGA